MKRVGKLSKVRIFAFSLFVVGLPTAYAEFVSTSPVQSREFDNLGWLGWVGLLGLLGLLGQLYKPKDKLADRSIVVGSKRK